MSISRQLARRLRQSVQGCTLHPHGPVQSWAAVAQACAEGKANKRDVAEYVIESCNQRINELLENGVSCDDQRILKEQKTRAFVEHLLLGGNASLPAPTPLLKVAAILSNTTNQTNVLLWRDKTIADVWRVPDGNVPAGEAVEQCVSRHVAQQFGLRMKNLKLFGVYNTCETRQSGVGSHDVLLHDDLLNDVGSRALQQNCVTIVYSGTVSGEIKPGVAEARFHPLEQLPLTDLEQGRFLSEFFNARRQDEISYA